MDTLIILTSLAVLILFMKKPRSRMGFVLFWVAWAAALLLFNHHVTSELALGF